MIICAVIGCSNGTYRLRKWKENNCTEHGCLHDRCPCDSPFQLYPFPTMKGDPHTRLQWIKAFNRKDAKTGKNWIPNADDLICSNHFVDGKPTSSFPYPSINLGHRKDCYRRKRSAPKSRTTIDHNIKIKKLKMEKSDAVTDNKLPKPFAVEPNSTNTTPDNILSNPVIKCEDITNDQTKSTSSDKTVDSVYHDHCYTNVQQGEMCNGCLERRKIIIQQQTTIEKLNTSSKAGKEKQGKNCRFVFED